MSIDRCTMLRVFLTVLMLLVTGLAGPSLSAQTRETPYWATIRASELNMRVGPGGDYPIAWVYRRPGLPVKVLRVKDGWRMIEDPDGERGWVVARLLAPERGAYVIGDAPAPMRAEADGSAPLRWRLEPGVAGRLGDCREGWCRLDVEEYGGWVPQERLWGAGTP
jgi:SH3-like domain-containing protein